jgi:hypothetical protein
MMEYSGSRGGSPEEEEQNTQLFALCLPRSGPLRILASKEGRCMNYHDGFYKRIFGFPQMVAGYLQDFVGLDFVANLDMDTLDLVSGQYVSDDLHSRENGVVWKVKWNDADAQLFIMGVSQGPWR